MMGQVLSTARVFLNARSPTFVERPRPRDRARLDGELKKIFFSALTIDAFDPPEHKSHFDFTLANPRNVQIQFLKFVKKIENWIKRI